MNRIIYLSKKDIECECECICKIFAVIFFREDMRFLCSNCFKKRIKILESKKNDMETNIKEYYEILTKLKGDKK